MARRDSLLGQCLAEFFGTLVLVFFGVGIVNAAVLAGVAQGLWQVAAVWGAAVALAVYATGAVSGAHINPAITVALATWRRFPLPRVAPYILAQVAGAFCGSLILYGLFHGLLQHFEAAHNLVRGAPGSELSAMVFGEYFPNPAMLGTTAEAYRQVSLLTAMLAEGIGAAFLATFVFVLTEPRNAGAPRTAVPIFIGLTLALIISIIAPLTQAGINPARDFGPRVLSYLLGWGHIAIPGPRGGFFLVYILSPVMGAVLGSGLYCALVRRHLPEQATSAPAPPEDASPVESGTPTMSDTPKPEPSVILVPCIAKGRAGCEIVQRAVELVADATPEAVIRAPEECPNGRKSLIVAVDASSNCQASSELARCGIKPGAVVSAPTVLAKAGLLRPGVDVRSHIEELAQPLAAAISASLQKWLNTARARRRYADDMGPVLARFDGLWSKVETLPSPDGAVSEEEKSRVELLARRARNLFVKMDEIVPPGEWSEPHDLFQDAMLCLAYATEGWAAGDADRWEQNMEKARVQIQPLLRRLQP